LEFKNPVDGTCTNMVKGTNNALKMKVMPRNRVKEGIENHLSEFVCFKKYAGELRPAFFCALKETHYTFDE
jgi:hypothetical protein